MIGDRGATTVGMPELAMRAALAHLDEAQTFQDRDDDARSKRRNTAHELGDFERLGANKGGFQRRLSILAQHVDHFEQIDAELVERGALRVRARPPGHIPDEEAGVLITLDDGSEGAHAKSCESPPKSLSQLGQAQIELTFGCAAAAFIKCRWAATRYRKVRQSVAAHLLP